MYNDSTLIGGQTSSTRGNLVKGNNLRPEPPEQELYVQIKDEVADQIIKHGLTKAESKLFFYLLKFDPDGSEMKNIPSFQEMAEAIGISAKQVKRSLAKLEEFGFYKTETNLIRRGRHLSRPSSSTIIKGEA
jgi:DNA replication protein DnaD